MGRPAGNAAPPGVGLSSTIRKNSKTIDLTVRGDKTWGKG
jgi:hypothetical protein